MSILDVLNVFGSAPRTAPDLQRWLETILVALQSVPHVRFATDDHLPADVELDALFSDSAKDKAIAVWTDSVAGTTATYFNNDGTWVEGPITVAAGATVPTGALLPNAMSIARAEALSPVWLICDGRAVSRTTYDDLFSVIGTDYGVGNGSTTFNVPDLRGRTIIGMDTMGVGQGAANVVTAAAADTVGGEGGEEYHQLTSAELPAHSHTVLGDTSANAGSVEIRLNDGTGTNSNKSTSSVGSDTPHNNMQPYTAFVYLIKA